MTTCPSPISQSAPLNAQVKKKPLLARMHLASVLHIPPPSFSQVCLLLLRQWPCWQRQIFLQVASTELDASKSLPSPAVECHGHRLEVASNLLSRGDAMRLCPPGKSQWSPRHKQRIPQHNEAASRRRASWQSTEGLRAGRRLLKRQSLEPICRDSQASGRPP
ncbi:hypothetical protein AAT19DRAFT_12027 [Rhodotorula toruloides]|uniref:Uncharacterized protein n=1 Tax=Rhodotorula toruloides TaxID=5286 RepID=A0A2T0AF28_RHOTO|nr:hypothetical protein AAT19DRAFT_12027 [Rhodotorula toruloides]